jgi:hypothetical protein
MKLSNYWLLTLLFTGASMLAAQDQSPKAPQTQVKPAKPLGKAAVKQTKPGAKPAKSAPTVPADAVQVSPGMYRWTDKEGKEWMYRKTPFGVSRWEANSEDSKQKAIVNQTTAVEQGDSVRFERVSPFGKQTWVKKKTDLDDTEQKIWARKQESNSASRSAEKE